VKHDNHGKHGYGVSRLNTNLDSRVLSVIHDNHGNRGYRVARPRTIICCRVQGVTHERFGVLPYYRVSRIRINVKHDRVVLEYIVYRSCYTYSHLLIVFHDILGKCFRVSRLL
jgi:hypothetical protein